MLRWIDLVWVGLTLAVMVVQMRGTCLLLDDGKIQRVIGFVFRLSISWDAVDSLKLACFRSALHLRSKYKRIAVSLRSDESEEMVREILHRVGDTCQVDPGIVPALKRWRKREEKRYIRPLFAVLFLLLILSRLWSSNEPSLSVRYDNPRGNEHREFRKLHLQSLAVSPQQKSLAVGVEAADGTAELWVLDAKLRSPRLLVSSKRHFYRQPWWGKKR